MLSEKTKGIAENYAARHEFGWVIFDKKPYGNYGLWEKPETTFDEARDALTEAVARAAGVKAGDRVLEVGCGYAASAVHYTKVFEPAAVVGLDVTEVRIEKGREYVAANGLADRIQLEVGDATALGFPSERFNRVIAIECALHFDTRYDFFREAARVLLPGGGLGLADIVLRKGADRESFLTHVHFPIGTGGSLDVPDNVYDASVYENLLRKCGFEDIRIEDVTDRTLAPLTDYLEQLGRETEGERGPRRIAAAQIYREYIEHGLEYVFVSARRSDDGAKA
ncbi:MAG: methyltransferase domain-containing protein [Deltaproteobacteria bacterium]|nr:methyltransferase domain-containing protein [Deltaproteobacteria bacterium]